MMPSFPATVTEFLSRMKGTKINVVHQPASQLLVEATHGPFILIG